MQTYYDPALKKWVTKLPDGTVRDATNAEALDAYSRGAQAPAGTPGPGTTSPTPALNPVVAHPLQPHQSPSIVLGGVTYTWNTATGKYEDAQGRDSGSVVGPPKETPAAPPTGPDMSWRGNDQYSVYGRLHGQGSYFPNLDTSQQLFYQTGEGQHPAWQQFMAGEADPNSYYSRWLGSQEGRVEGAFKNASVANPNLQRKDYYDQAAQGLYSTFAQLPGWQQGYNPQGGFAGRRM